MFDSYPQQHIHAAMDNVPHSVRVWTSVPYNERTLRLHSLESEDTLSPDKPVLLFVHGMFCTSVMFSFYMSALSDKYHVIVLDVPGGGVSDSFDSHTEKTAEELLNEWVDVLHSFLSQRRIPRIHLVGHSLGGYMAFRYAEAHPEHTDSLILVNPCGMIPHVNPVASWITRNAIPHHLVWWVYPFVRPWISNPIVRFSLAQLAMVTENRFLLQKFIEKGVCTHPWIHRLLECPVPIRLLVGGKDRMVSTQDAELVRLLSNHRIPVHVSDEAGHALCTFSDFGALLVRHLP